MLQLGEYCIGDALGGTQQTGQAIPLVDPVRINLPLARQAIQRALLNLMDQFARLTFRRNKVIPAARGFDLGRYREDAIGQRVSPVVVKEEPPVQALLSQGVLNRRLFASS